MLLCARPFSKAAFCGRRSTVNYGYLGYLMAIFADRTTGLHVSQTRLHIIKFIRAGTVDSSAILV
jgi:hypothetical protein